MPNLTSVGITAGIPTSGTGTVSTIDNFLGVAGTPSTQVLSVQGVSSGTAQPNTILDAAGSGRGVNVDINHALYTDLQAVGGSTVTTAGTGIQLVGVASGSGGSAITATSNALDVNIKSGTVTATTGGLTDTQLRATPVPVSGTVTVTSTTANAGTNLNTSALALETGGNLAAVATATGAVSDTAVTDPTLSGSEIALLKGIISTLDTDAVTLGQATKANSVPVTIASDQGATAVTGTFWQATQPVSGTVTANAGTNLDTSTLALETGGNLATIATNTPAVGQTTMSASVPVTVASDQSNLTTQYAPVASLVSGAITSAMTGTTSTSLLDAPAGSLRNYVTSIIVSNSHATVGTDVILQDGSGGTTLMTIPAAPAYGGAVVYLNPPLVQPTVATALYCANVTTGSSTKVSAVGYTAL